MHRVRRLAIVTAFLAALGSSAAVAIAQENPRFEPTAADEKLADSVVFRKSDFKTAKGGVRKPSLTAFTCSGYAQADLVVTGASASEFTFDSGWGVSTLTWVLRSPEMVRTDAGRLRSIPYKECLRRNYEEDPRVEVVSVAPIPGFPQLAPYTRATRVVYDYDLGKESIRAFDDVIDVFKGRVETGFVLTAPYEALNGAKEADITLTKLLLQRATPPKLVGYTIPIDALVPAAGKTFTLKGLMVQPDRFDGEDNTTGMVKALLPPDSISCTATLAGSPIAGAGKGGCRWQLPDDATGKRLLVLARVSLMGAEATYRIPFDVE